MKIKEQYKNSNNLDTRISIYQFSDSEISFSQFIKNNIGYYSNLKVLELGCGNGDLWKEIGNNFTNCEITISDYSQGMLNVAKKNLKDYDYKFKNIDFHDIPFDNESFDIIISNHNLYHSNNIYQVVGEIQRVLRKKGTLITSTNSSNHLNQLKQLLLNFKVTDSWLSSDIATKYSMESATPILEKYSDNITSFNYNHNLKIPNSSIIINYLRSLNDMSINKLIEIEKHNLIDYIEEKISNLGYFLIEAKAGLITSIKN